MITFQRLNAADLERRLKQREQELQELKTQLVH